METYTIREAMQIIREKPYLKLSHPYFSPGEYIYCDDFGHVCDENDYILIWDEFWGLRATGGMKDGWYILEDGVWQQNS